MAVQIMLTRTRSVVKESTDLDVGRFETRMSVVHIAYGPSVHLHCRKGVLASKDSNLATSEESRSTTASGGFTVKKRVQTRSSSSFAPATSKPTRPHHLHPTSSAMWPKSKSYGPTVTSGASRSRAALAEKVFEGSRPSKYVLSSTPRDRGVHAPEVASNRCSTTGAAMRATIGP